MLTFTLRRLLLAIPTLLVISLVIFLLVDLAPGIPMSEIPLTVPPEVRAEDDRRHGGGSAGVRALFPVAATVFLG